MLKCKFKDYHLSVFQKLRWSETCNKVKSCTNMAADPISLTKITVALNEHENSPGWGGGGGLESSCRIHAWPEKCEKIGGSFFDTERTLWESTLGIKRACLQEKGFLLNYIRGRLEVISKLLYSTKRISPLKKCLDVKFGAKPRKILV